MGTNRGAGHARVEAIVRKGKFARATLRGTPPSTGPRGDVHARPPAPAHPPRRQSAAYAGRDPPTADETNGYANIRGRQLMPDLTTRFRAAAAAVARCHPRGGGRRNFFRDVAARLGQYNRHMTFAEISAALPPRALTACDGLPFPRVASGKVREIFDLGDALLLVASDRLSAFDVVLPDGIPGKGAILTQISNWWFARTAHLIRNHLLPDQAGELARRGIHDRDLQLRSMVVRKLKTVPIECVVRGYLVGSGWSSYQKSGDVCGIRLPAGLRQADRLPEPIFTPTTKAPKGQHDAPIDDAQGRALVGTALYEQLKQTSLALYRLGHEQALRAGMILADTKFEFGTDAAGGLWLIDELLTPDSSRYWPADSYAPGQSPPSYDKQFVRDHLLAIKWDQQPPGPRLPAEVIARTQEKYLAALRNLLG